MKSRAFPRFFPGLIVLAFLMGAPAQAVLPADLAGGPANGPVAYRFGSEWGRRKPTPQDLADPSTPIAKALGSAARWRGSSRSGTAFYLGKFAGRHLMGTNFHVIEGTPCVEKALFGSRRNSADFMALKKKFGCRQELGRWRDIEFAIFEIQVKPEEESLLKGVGVVAAFDDKLEQGQMLLGAGYGIADNDKLEERLSLDSDCRVLSGTEDFRFLMDPDRMNPAGYQVWSFAHGCDAGHGDSGTAYLDRTSGKWVGLLWTGAFPVSPEMRDSARIDELMRAQSGKIWSQANYAVPVSRIRSYLEEQLAAGKVKAEDVPALQAFLRQEDQNR